MAARAGRGFALPGALVGRATATRRAGRPIRFELVAGAARTPTFKLQTELEFLRA
ncbi:Hypothetical protein SMAX5B_000619 [Scophthalmus maximus]|uniref:Uncharacterized protein n=1 Tax=Scophthalmus maximus TaxID=52904 RepID=A0A2U9B652_SCOMX|nr:Hypothetical protein SMAX5B_000619 [Scophthalmus maximus]